MSIPTTPSNPGFKHHPTLCACVVLPLSLCVGFNDGWQAATSMSAARVGSGAPGAESWVRKRFEDVEKATSSIAEMHQAKIQQLDELHTRTAQAVLAVGHEQGEIVRRVGELERVVKHNANFDCTFNDIKVVTGNLMKRLRKLENDASGEQKFHDPVNLAALNERIRRLEAEMHAIADRNGVPSERGKARMQKAVEVIADLKAQLVKAEDALADARDYKEDYT